MRASTRAGGGGFAVADFPEEEGGTGKSPLLLYRAGWTVWVTKALPSILMTTGTTGRVELISTEPKKSAGTKLESKKGA